MPHGDHFIHIQVQVEVEAEPGAVGDRVLVRQVTIFNMSQMALDASLTLTAEETELWYLERVHVGAIPRGGNKMVRIDRYI